MVVPFIYLKDAEWDQGDNFNQSQAAPPNAELERHDDSGSSETTTESTTESTKEKCLSAKEKKALKKKKDSRKRKTKKMLKRMCSIRGSKNTTFRRWAAT